MFTNPTYVVESSIDKTQLVNGSSMQNQHPGWFRSMGLLSRYDVFISHRMKGLHDDKLVNGMYDRLTNYSIESSHRSIYTFLDKRRLRDGRDCLEEFTKALINSTLIVPIVSRYALERMVKGKHKPNECDCVLVEWIISIECYKSKRCVSGIFPILIGTIFLVSKLSME